MSHQLTPKRLFLIWYPLLTAWLLMAVEGPLIAAILARLPEAKINLAAYGVAFVLALIVESPVIMLMSASTALVRDQGSYERVLRYTMVLNGLSTGLVLLVLSPPVFNTVVRGWMSLPETVADRVWMATLLLLPWPAAIGYRRFYQGVMIVAGHTRKVMGATLLRVAAMASACLALARWSTLEGAAIGGAALSAGVMTEALVVRWMARPSVRAVISRTGDPDVEAVPPLTLGHFVRFYYPLTLTAFLTLGVQPLVTFFVGRAALPLESLAVLPVLHGVTFVFRCFSLSFQDVILAQLSQSRGHFAVVRRFAAGVAGLSFLLFAALPLTPLGRIWIEGLAGLPQELARVTQVPLLICCFLPLLSMTASFWSAVAMAERRTFRITLASLFEVGCMTLVLWMGVTVSPWTGAVLAALALVVGRGASAFYLWQTQHLSPAWHGHEKS